MTVELYEATQVAASSNDPRPAVQGESAWIDVYDAIDGQVEAN